MKDEALKRALAEADAAFRREYDRAESLQDQLTQVRAEMARQHKAIQDRGPDNFYQFLGVFDAAEKREKALRDAARKIIDPTCYSREEDAVLPDIEDRLELLAKVGDKQDNERGAPDSERTVQRDMHALAQAIMGLRRILERGEQG